MSIITVHDFKAENSIAQIENSGVQDELQEFIDKYEPKFLKSLLGDDLYLAFISGLSEDPIPEKWTDLRDTTDLKEMLVNYIYYWYIRNNSTQTAGVSEVKGKTENGTSVSSATKMCRSWNEMSRMARFFDLSTATYPEYVRPFWGIYRRWYYGCPVSDIYYPINEMNI